MPPKSSKSTKPTSNSPAPLKVPWPTLQPKKGLQLRLEELEPDQILIIDNFLSAKECAALVKVLESLPLLASPPAKKGEAHRTNSRFATLDPTFAHALYTSTPLAALLASLPSLSRAIPPPRPKGLNPSIRIYKYEPGQRFEKHYDDSVYDPSIGTSEWTLLFYLTGLEDGVLGGQTVFYPDSPRVRPEIIAPLRRGTLLLHRHGSACLLHEGREVERGTKWVLRSDLMFG